jgi:hypothetical protein
MSHFSTLVTLKGSPKKRGKSKLEAWVSTQIESLLEPFCVFPNDTRYMEFEDETDKIKHGYTAEMQGLYSTLAEYAEHEHGYFLDDEHQAYGSWFNANAFYDWHQVGGRYAFMFLVKKNCRSAVRGERSWTNVDAVRKAPRGYKWVAGTRKRDIAWEKMDSHERELNASGADCKYFIDTYAYLENGEHYSRGDFHFGGEEANNMELEAWRQMTHEFIKNIDDDDFIVAVDCHI